MTITPETLTWHALAQDALAQIRSARESLPHDDTFRPEAHDPDPDDHPQPAIRGARRIAPRVDAGRRTAHRGDTDVPKPPKPKRRAPPVPACDLVLLFRLCATFGSTARIAHMLAPGAVTVIETGAVLPNDAKEMITSAFVPGEITVDTPTTVLTENGSPSTLAAVTLADPEHGGSARVESARLIKALEHAGPVICLVPGESDIPDDIRHCLPVPLDLAPLSADIIVALLRETHGLGDTDEAALRARLPMDLSDVSWPVLATALREDDAFSCVTALASMTVVENNDGPTLADIEGYGDAEETARNMVADLQAWNAGTLAWSDVQRSVLFHGAPGTGKSFLATAMGNSAGVCLVRGSFAEWQAAGHLGDMLKSMRSTFQKAARSRPAILVIDEVDALGDRADPDTHARNYRQQVINGFLAELDALKRLEGLLVVGTCNFPERIDAAALRPGRFDVKVEVPLPSLAALRRMLRDGLPNLNEEDLVRLTAAAAGQSAADLDGALRAARSYARRQSRAVGPTDVLAQLDAEDRPDELDRRIATHECGHAIIFTALRLGRVERIAVLPGGGGTWIRAAPAAGSLEDCEAQLTHLLAGRAAERLIHDVVTAGAGGNETSDLARATRIAIDIDTKLGLGDEGLVWTDLDQNLYLRDPQNAARVQHRLEAAEARALALLAEHEGLLRGMGDALFEARMLEGDALERWLLKVESVPILAVDQNPPGTIAEPTEGANRDSHRSFGTA